MDKNSISKEEVRPVALNSTGGEGGSGIDDNQ